MTGSPDLMNEKDVVRQPWETANIKDMFYAMFFEKKLDILMQNIIQLVSLDGYRNSHSFSLDGPYRASFLE